MIKINTAPRASISPEFVDVSKQIARAKIEKFKTAITAIGNPKSREYFAKTHRGLLLNAGNMIAKPEVWDDIITRLRCLPYTSFDVVTEPVARSGYQPEMATLLRGVTKPVILHCSGKYGHIDAGDYDMGQYEVYFPVEELKNDGYNHFHFVPQNSPMTPNRHVHHVANARTFSTTPLTMNPSTCWGGFPTIIQNLIIDFDIVELFRNISVYLNRYDEHSPLCSLFNIAWRKQIL